MAYGTPFAGELARVGANVFAPLDTLFFLVQGPVNRIEPISQLAAARELLRHTLFFAQDSELVNQVFHSALEFVSRANAARLVFTPALPAWELVPLRPAISPTPTRFPHSPPPPTTSP